MMDSAMDGDAPLLCEVAWEVCHQVGGIYTVLRSKAPVVEDRWGDRYAMIGPYDAGAAAAEFEETPPEGPFRRAVDRLRGQGLVVHFGRWLVTGRPQVVLLDLDSVRQRLGQVKYYMWLHHRIPSPADDWLIHDVLLFGYMVEEFLRAVVDTSHQPVIAHFHEWMAGTAIPELRRNNLPVSIVFTTHATQLGRALAMNDPWFHDHVPFVNWEADADRYRIDCQVRLERAAAHGAHVFTTLSDVTAYESRHMLGRTPDLLLPNGLNITRFEAVHEFQNLHRRFKDRISEFVIGHFFPAYSFDIDNTLYFFSAGRYEYRNKGFDLTLDALSALNGRMKQAGTDRTVVFFLFTKRPYRSINSEVLHSQAQMAEIRKNCRTIRDQVYERLFRATTMNRHPPLDELVDDTLRLRLRRLRLSWRISRMPVIVTHDLADDAHDEVLNHLRAYNLVNLPEDRVKVIYHPEFLTSSNPLLGLDYDQFVRGCHLGIFPSYYEPWGYTPEECMALAVPAVTSDLSGFGSYLLQNMPDYRDRGLLVVHRRMNSYGAALDELSDYLWQFVQLDRRERLAMRNTVEASSHHFDWSNLVQHYWEAYEEVLRRTARGTELKMAG